MLVYRKKIHAYAKIISIIAIFTSHNFHRYYSRGLQLRLDHDQMVNEPTHKSGFLIDHVYIKKALMEEFFTNVTV